jgi:hypothetical protein
MRSAASIEGVRSFGSPQDTARRCLAMGLFRRFVRSASCCSRSFGSPQDIARRCLAMGLFLHFRSPTDCDYAEPKKTIFIPLKNKCPLFTKVIWLRLVIDRVAPERSS